MYVDEVAAYNFKSSLNYLFITSNYLKFIQVQKSEYRMIQLNWTDNCKHKRIIQK